jgi:uncharacterized protein YebE (UPF0316 family)
MNFDAAAWFGRDLFEIVGFPLLIFLARVSDVSLGTLRTVAVSRGLKGRAAVLGFFEVLIWLTAITYILQHLTTITNYFAYAGGFATGNYVGLKIEEKLALGLLGVTIITNRDARELIQHLKEREFGITSVSAMGSTGRVRIVFSVIRRKNFGELRELVERFHPNAFMAVQNVRTSSKAVYPFTDQSRGWLGWLRKSK